jgi:hypothetical protein
MTYLLYEGCAMASNLTNNSGSQPQAVNMQRIVQPADGVTTLLNLPVQLPAALENGYAWHLKDNEDAYNALFSGLLLATRLKYDSQILQYYLEIERLMKQDMAHRLAHYVFMDWGYEGFCRPILDLFEEHPLVQASGFNPAELHPSKLTGVRIPSEALEAIVWLDEYAPAPDYVIILTSLTPKKYVCALYVGWIIAVAEWQ